MLAWREPLLDNIRPPSNWPGFDPPPLSVSLSLSLNDRPPLRALSHTPPPTPPRFCSLAPAGTVVPVAASADGSSYQASYFAANSAAGSGTYTFQVSEVGSDSTFPVYSHHGGAGSNPLPFGTEYIILAVMGYVVFFASNNPQ